MQYRIAKLANGKYVIQYNIMGWNIHYLLGSFDTYEQARDALSAHKCKEAERKMTEEMIAVFDI